MYLYTCTCIPVYCESTHIFFERSYTKKNKHFEKLSMSFITNVHLLIQEHSQMSAFVQGSLDFSVVAYELVAGIIGLMFKCLYHIMELLVTVQRSLKRLLSVMLVWNLLWMSDKHENCNCSRNTNCLSEKQYNFLLSWSLTNKK